jgi:hypothetical protein
MHLADKLRLTDFTPFFIGLIKHHKKYLKEIEEDAKLKLDEEYDYKCFTIDCGLITYNTAIIFGGGNLIYELLSSITR